MVVFGAASRLRILYALIDGERHVDDLASLLELSANTISQQLRVLRAARAVRVRREDVARTTHCTTRTSWISWRRSDTTPSTRRDRARGGARPQPRRHGPGAAAQQGRDARAAGVAGRPGRDRGLPGGDRRRLRVRRAARRRRPQRGRRAHRVPARRGVPAAAARQDPAADVRLRPGRGLRRPRRRGHHPVLRALRRLRGARPARRPLTAWLPAGDGDRGRGRVRRQRVGRRLPAPCRPADRLRGARRRRLPRADRRLHQPRRGRRRHRRRRWASTSPTRSQACSSPW